MDATPEIIPPGIKRRRRRPLKSLINIRDELADVIRAIKADAIEPRKGNALIQGLGMLAKVQEALEVEHIKRQLDAIETRERTAPSESAPTSQ